MQRILDGILLGAGLFIGWTIASRLWALLAH
jgi:hypothetical protein